MYRCSKKKEKKGKQKRKEQQQKKLKKHYNVVNPHKDDLRCKLDF